MTQAQHLFELLATIAVSSIEAAGTNRLVSPAPQYEVPLHTLTRAFPRRHLIISFPGSPLLTR